MLIVVISADSVCAESPNDSLCSAFTQIVAQRLSIVFQKSCSKVRNVRHQARHQLSNTSVSSVAKGASRRLMAGTRRPCESHMRCHNLKCAACASGFNGMAYMRTAGYSEDSTLKANKPIMRVCVRQGWTLDPGRILRHGTRGWLSCKLMYRASLCVQRIALVSGLTRLLRSGAESAICRLYAPQRGSSGEDIFKGHASHWCRA